jgi:hypothetical protein
MDLTDADMKVITGLLCLRIGPVLDCCEYGNKRSGSTNLWVLSLLVSASEETQRHKGKSAATQNTNTEQ